MEGKERKKSESERGWMIKVCVNVSQVAGISWLEKKAAAALYGSPPESSYKEALESLMKVQPTFIFCLLNLTFWLSFLRQRK